MFLSHIVVTMNIDSQFGRSVRALRLTRGVSQRHFAAQLSYRGMTVDASAVSRIENGERSVRLHEAVIIAEVLACRISDLIDEGGAEVMSVAEASVGAVIAELEKLRSSIARSAPQAPPAKMDTLTGYGAL